MRILHLYRPRVPVLRAQAIQVIHTCHALARLGHEVTLLADRAEGIDPTEALGAYGLEPCEDFHLLVSPMLAPGPAGAWFRWRLALWWLGAPGVVLARDKKRLAAAVRWLPRRHRIVLETHELDSLLATDRGESPRNSKALEARCLAAADALVANCGGTLAAWQTHHGDALPPVQQVVHNGTHADRMRPPRPTERTEVRVLGSMRSYKGVRTIVAAAPRMPAPLHWIGATAEECAAHGGHEAITVSGPVPYDRVPERLAGAAALLLPLADNRFGREMTSPLKLWDYLATGLPIIAPDLPTVREIGAATGASLHTHAPGDVDSLVAATSRALQAGTRPPFLRSWDDRATELTTLFEALS